MKALAYLSLLTLTITGCIGESVAPDDEREHDARFVGTWLVEQPTHALYEATYYSFEATGTVVVGGSVPDDCSGHLSQHCVTGSVANCVPDETGSCEGVVSCIFADSWHSLDSATISITGTCSDDRTRQIVIGFEPNSGSNTEFGGAGGTLLSVGGESTWSHDNWPWAFRKCPAGTDETTCSPRL